MARGHEGNLFLLTVQEVVNACGAWHKMADVQSQMKDLMERLGQWVKSHKDKVRLAYLTVKRGGGLFFMAVMRGKEYDAELESHLTELDIEVANDGRFELLQVSVLAIPDSPQDCIESFLTNC